MSQGVSRKAFDFRLAAWMLYDFAATAFVVVVVTLIGGLYFKRIVAPGPTGDLLWGAAGAASTVLVAAAAPLLGAAADEGGCKARYLTIFSLAAIVASACIGATHPGMAAVGFILFVAANSAFQVASVFYHAYLPELASEANLSRLSGYGWAMGYAGAIFAVLAVSPLISGGISLASFERVRLAFPLQAAIFLLLSLPAFWLLRERQTCPVSPGRGVFRRGGARLLETWRGVRGLSQLTRFLIAYVLYNDGLNTVLYFSIIYAADTLGLSMRQLVPLYLLVQTSGIVGAVGFGRLGDRIGIKPTLAATLALWLFVLLGAWAARTAGVFFVVAAAAGLLIGSTQALSRAMMALLTPPGRAAEFFSFYGVSGRVSAAAGPLTFGLVSYLTGSQRPAILSIAAFFLIGLALLLRVEVGRGVAEKMAASRGRYVLT